MITETPLLSKDPFSNFRPHKTGEKSTFSNSSSPLLFEERFRKARISGRISVDSRPNRRNKTVFSIFYGVT